MDYQGKKVAVVGLGISNRALISFLSEKGAQITACDQKDPSEIADLQELQKMPIVLQLGDGYLRNLASFEEVFLTPGMRKDLPEIAEAAKAGVRLSTEVGLFMEGCPALMVGVTGSSGKTTTTTLLGQMMATSRRETFVGGNIGVPLIGELDRITPDAQVVLELSSFQLELTRTSPQISVVTNITPNHLDVHPSMEAYIEAKTNIYGFQGSEDHFITNLDDPICVKMAAQAPGKVYFFSITSRPERGAYIEDDRLYYRVDSKAGVPVCRVSDIKLRGVHNVGNVLTAITAAALAGIGPGAMAEVIKGFTGVAHRLEPVTVWQNVQFVNDSIATTPTRAAAGLRSFDEPIILICGGYDKKIPFEEMIRAGKGRVKAYIILGATADLIERTIHTEYQDVPPDIHRVESLEEAVQTSIRLGESGDVVLLSPGCASYDMFESFTQRGELFRQLVFELTGVKTA
ncbi:MAG: UDP-N-acetylmuramoyl-L-alanine--D-glutamate ligase [Limnochordia bacterium]|nr:UDP-N-acetylmuramoyl-L-alanine--D-glutamate ligase [Limnochordia bacterium]MDD4517736.1 UDP-N-acetylmuramoyl-L-alanine--D-glutamate ligase [Limnochordia bacterium]